MEAVTRHKYRRITASDKTKTMPIILHNIMCMNEDDAPTIARTYMVRSRVGSGEVKPELV